MPMPKDRTISREIIIELIDLVLNANAKSKRYRFEACIGESVTHDKQRVFVSIVDDAAASGDDMILHEMYYTTDEVAKVIDKLRTFIAEKVGKPA